MTSLTFHPFANVFPLLEGEEFDALVADIQASGLCEAIWLYEGQILDGRNRYRACQALGRDCATQLYTGDDPVGFVISMNLRRRHLTESQRAMVGARLAPLPRGANQHTEISAPTQHEAASLLHVSADSIQTARKIQQEGAQEIIDAVDTGAIAVSAAVHLTALPREDQRTALQEAQHQAMGNKITAKQTRDAVRRRQDATPVTADEDGHPQAAAAARIALPTRLSQLLKHVEALATIPDLGSLILDIPRDCYDRVDRCLDPALDALSRLQTLWKEHRHNAPEVLVKPAPGQTQHKKKQPQPALILEALRKAPQPLRLQDLQKRFEGSRGLLLRKLARLVQQGKIQRTRAGYVVVST